MLRFLRKKKVGVPSWARVFSLNQYQLFLILLQAYGTKHRIKMEVNTNNGECCIHETRATIGFSLQKVIRYCKKNPLHAWQQIITDYIDGNRLIIHSISISCPKVQSTMIT